VDRRNDQDEQGGQAQQQLHGASPLTGPVGLWQGSDGVPRYLSK